MIPAAWASARHLLCVRLDSLGDVLMCTPAMRALRESLPGVRLTLLASASGAAAVPYIDELDGVIDYPAPWMKASTPHGAALDSACIARLAQQRFDGACIFTSYSQSALPAALLCHLAGIPLRLAHCRENPYRLLSHWVPDHEPGQLVRHEVRRQLDLVASIGCSVAEAGLSFTVRAADLAAVRARLAEAGIGGGTPFILLHPGASAPSRRYPPQHWSALCALLAARTGMALVVTGSGAEQALAEQLRAACPAPLLSLAGELDLGELGAAIQLAAVMVSNNTGPAHMAAAIGTPLVDLYALTNPQHTPWQVRNRLLFHDVPCRFCHKSVCPEGHHDCLRKLAPATVADAVCGLLAWPGGAPRHSALAPGQACGNAI